MVPFPKIHASLATDANIPRIVRIAGEWVVVRLRPCGTVLDAADSLLLAFSVNYFVPEEEMRVDDPNTALKIYQDKNTASGNVIQVQLTASRVP